MSKFLWQRETQVIDRQCVLYATQDRAWELAILLNKQYGTVGDDAITPEDIQARAEAVIEMWACFDPSKPTCYICGRPQPRTPRLCVCFYEVNVSVLNVPEIIRRRADNHIESNYFCPKCCKVVALDARAVKSKHRKGLPFKFPLLCQQCFLSREAQSKQSPPRSQPIQVKSQPTELDKLKESAAQQAPVAQV